MVFVTLNIFANEQNRGKRRCCSANFTLGPGVICIYIESIRFWFIIVTILGGGGELGAAGRHSVTCYEALVHEHPWETKASDNYGAGTKLALLSPFTHCFKPEDKKWNAGGCRARLCFAALWGFQETPKITENEINLSAQHWSCGDYSLSLTLINPHVPVFALSQCAGANYIQAESEEMHCRWSHDKWLFCPVMEIWIIIECLYSDVRTWYDSQWIFCQRTDELCCFYFKLPSCI